MRFRHVVGAAVVTVLATACSLGSPSDAGSLNLYLEVDKGTLPLGESITITVTARNVGYDRVTLTGPSDCLLYVEILSTQGQVVWNSNGNCAGSTVTEEVLAGQDKVQPFIWSGTDLVGGRVGSGFYHIRPVARVTGAAYFGPLLSIAVE